MVEEWFENFTKHELNVRKRPVRSLDGLFPQRRACPRWAPTRLRRRKEQSREPTSLYGVGRHERSAFGAVLFLA